MKGSQTDITAVSEKLAARSKELERNLKSADAAGHAGQQLNRAIGGATKELVKDVPVAGKGLVVYTDLKQAQVSKEIDERTEHQKAAAKQFAFQAAKASLRNEKFRREIQNCTSMADIERVESWHKLQSEVMGQNLAEPVRRAAENEYRDALAQLVTINAKGTRANEEAIQAGRAEVAVLSKDVELGFKAMHNEAKAASLLMADVLELQASQKAEIEQGNLDALLRDEKLLAFVSDHHELVSEHVAEERAREEKLAYMERHRQLKEQCDSLAELGQLTGVKELIVAGRASSVALDLKEAIISFRDAGTVTAAVNPAIAAAVAVMTIVSMFRQQEKDPLQRICETILREVREFREVLSQSIEGLTEENRNILKTMCVHFRLIFEGIQETGWNIANTIRVEVEILSHQVSFWGSESFRLLDALSSDSITKIQIEYESPESTMSRIEKYTNEVRSDITTLHSWIKNQCISMNGSTLTAMGSEYYATKVTYMNDCMNASIPRFPGK